MQINETTQLYYKLCYLCPIGHNFGDIWGTVLKQARYFSFSHISYLVLGGIMQFVIFNILSSYILLNLLFLSSVSIDGSGISFFLPHPDWSRLTPLTTTPIPITSNVPRRCTLGITGPYSNF